MDCIITYIDDPFRPGNFAFDFKQADVDASGGILELDFGNLIKDDFRIVGVEDKSDMKSVSITAKPADPDKTLVYTFNETSTWWSESWRTDEFAVRFKEMVTGEIVVIKVSIRSVETALFDDESPDNITIEVKYPYPPKLLVNLDLAWDDPSTPPDYVMYKAGFVDPAFIDEAGVSPYSNREMEILIQPLGSDYTTTFQTTVPFYVAPPGYEPVNEESDPFAFANVILEFQPAPTPSP